MLTPHSSTQFMNRGVFLSQSAAMEPRVHPLGIRIFPDGRHKFGWRKLLQRTLGGTARRGTGATREPSRSFRRAATSRESAVQIRTAGDLGVRA